MIFTVATAALLAETAAAAAVVTSSSSHPFTSSRLYHGQEYPWNHRDAGASTLKHPSRGLEALTEAVSSDKKKKTKQEHVMDIAKTLLHNKKSKASSMSNTLTSSRGQKLQGWIAKGRQYQLYNLVQQEETIEECNPYSFADMHKNNNNNADVGILSCGQGRYCVESSLVSSDKNPVESSLGGVCINMPDESTVDLLDNMMLLSPQVQQQGNRLLQANGTSSTSIIEEVYDICYGNSSGPYVTCNCEGVDVELYTGSLTCQYEQICGNLDNVCGDNVTFCYRVTYDLSVTAPYTGTMDSIYDFTSPTVFQYQYGVVYAGSPEPDSCTIAFNGTQCTSCEFTQTLYEGDDTPTDCLAFDCGNTELGLSATVCEYNIVELITADYLLYGSLPCPGGCNLCGEGGYMTLTDQNISFPNGQIYNCKLVETAALAGYFKNVEPDLCTLLPPVVEEDCGCMGGDVISTEVNITEAPSEGDVPTEMPVLAPVGVPTDPPVEGAGQTPPPPVAAGQSRFGLATTVVSVAMGWVFLLQVMMTA